MKKVSLVFIFILLTFLTSCSKVISLKGEEDVVVELGSMYNDEGINIPDSYTYEEKDNININKCGKYYYTYRIYNKGKYVGELTRKVEVVDTTAPTYVLKDIDKLCVGIKYDKEYFFESISDNSKYTFYPSSSILFYDEGWHEISFSIVDESKNEVSIEKEYNVIKEKEPLILKLKEEDRIIRYDNGDIKVFFGSSRNSDYFHFYKDGNTYIYKINEIEENKNINIEYIYSITVSSEGLKEHSNIIIDDLCFEFDAYIYNSLYIDDQFGYSKDISNTIENTYKLLTLYVDLFSIN